MHVIINSGAPITLESGSHVIVNSGLYVQISGQGVDLQSGEFVIINSGAPVTIESGSFVIINSGAPVTIESGSHVIINSGAPVHIAGISLSGLTTRILTTTSGHIKIDVPTKVKTGGILSVTGNSGGQILWSTAAKSTEVVSVQIKALSGTVFIGGIQDGEQPVAASSDLMWSAVGFMLFAGETKTIDVDNTNRVRVAVDITDSGDTISWLGVAEV